MWTGRAVAATDHTMLTRTPLPVQRHIRCFLGVAGAKAVFLAPCSSRSNTEAEWLFTVDGPLTQISGPPVGTLRAVGIPRTAASRARWRRDEVESLIGPWPALPALGIEAIAFTEQRTGPRERPHLLMIGWDGRRSQQADPTWERPAHDLLRSVGPDLPCCRPDGAHARQAPAWRAAQAGVGRREAGQTVDRNSLVEYMVHELRSPLQALACSLEDPSPTGGEPTEDARMATARAAAHHIDALLEDLEQRTKEPTGQEDAPHPPGAHSLRLQLVTAEVAALVDAELRASGGLELRLELAHDATAFGDPLKTRQILLNLVRNAIHHASHIASTIELSTADDEDGVRITVSDDGAGVPEDALGRLFEPGFRARRESIPGRGLGLAISRRLAEEMGGSLTVRHSVNGGLRFELHLPGSPRDGQHVAASDNPERPLALVIEDDAMNAELFVSLLQDQARCVVADSVAAAIEALEERAPTLALLDLTLGSDDGRRVLEVLRERGVPTIIVTGRSLRGLDRTITAPPVRQALRKPVEPDLLRDLVFAAISEQQHATPGRTA